MSLVVRFFMKTRRFVDQVSIHIRAGKGGDGSCSFRREACVPEGGPDGGDGGRGGHVIFKGCRDVDSLIALYFSPLVFAEDGVPGRGQKMFGRMGKDLVVLLPCGTEVFNEETDEMVADIIEHDQEIILAKGGDGGMGNVHFRTSTHQVPTEHTPGEPGEEFRLRLELKIIADAGLIGFPNAGKSSLLTHISDARPKVASYPFTTLNPIVGTVNYENFSQLRVADIPGIIEGAADGVGLGLDFLRHISRSSVLVYIIDMAGTDDRNPWDDYKQLRKEIKQYDEVLLKRPSIVIANKIDQQAAIENLPTFIKKTRTKPIPMSALDAKDPGVLAFKQRLQDLLKPIPRGAFQIEKAKKRAEKVKPVIEADEQEFISEETFAKATFFDLAKKKTKKQQRELKSE
jgi:GTP-binding protein